MQRIGRFTLQGLVGPRALSYATLGVLDQGAVRLIAA